MTAQAKAVYLEMRQRCIDAVAKNDPTNNHCTMFRMVDDAIRRLIPSDPLSKNYALSEPLANMFRIRKGRLRIVWIADSESRELLIVFISNTPRKEGDARDPYRILTKMMKDGHLKNLIDEWRRLTEPAPGASIH